MRGEHTIAFYTYRGRSGTANYPIVAARRLGDDGFGLEMRLRHEMRGLALHWRTRQVLCRPFHKLWQVGQRRERLEQEASELLGVPSIPLVEQVDGQLVQSFLVDERLYFATRSGRTQVTFLQRPV